MTKTILISVILGILVGYFLAPEWFIGAIGTIIIVGLSIFLIFIGIDMGQDGALEEVFSKSGLRLLIFPFAAIIGSLAGAALCAIFLPVSLSESLAIGSGFGWYTLAPNIIMDYSVEAGTISFIHNILRELLGIILIPIVAKKIGYVETTALPGAAAMDVCLPVVEKATNSSIVVYSFVVGVVMTIAVPILTPLFINM